jgi:antitoxin CcdA
MGKAELKIEIDADLLARAKASGTTLEDFVEGALRAALGPTGFSEGEERARKWADDNAEAIADYNRRIAARGLIGDEFRKW